MPFDRTAHRAQVMRAVTHAAGGEVLLQLAGKGVAVPAVISADRPKGTEVNPNVGAQALEVVTLARDSFLGRTLPRQGQHFTDSTGRIYRIQEDRSVSHSATLVYACGTAAPLA